VGWFWFLGTLVPMIGLVQVGEQAMADRYAYLSFIGLFLMVCWGIADWAERVPQPLDFARGKASDRGREAGEMGWEGWARIWVAAASAAVLIALAALTWRQLNYWDDNVTLWSRMLAITPGSFEVEENLGVALLEGGRAEDAMQHFENVTVLAPSSHEAMGREQAGYAAVAHLYIGAYEQRRGKPQEAIAQYQQVLSLAQAFAAQNVYANLPPVLTKVKAAALGNMGKSYFVLRSYGDARDSFQVALALDPRSADLWIGLGLAEQKCGDLTGAIEAYSRALRLQASDVSYLLLAQVLEESGRAGEAQAAKQQAAMVSPNMATAQQRVDELLNSHP